MTKNKQLFSALWIVAIIIWVTINFSNRIGLDDKKTISKKYVQYSDSLTEIVTYVECSPNTNISIRQTNNQAVVIIYDAHGAIKKTLDEDAPFDAFKRLFEGGCEIITKKYDVVYFQFASSLDDGGGILYMSSGEAPPLKDCDGVPLITQEIEDNFYYYRTDWSNRRGPSNYR